MALQAGKPCGRDGSGFKPCLRAFISLLISFCELCIKDRPKGRGFYVLAGVGCFPASTYLPHARMLMAALTSRSSSAPQSQLCQRSDRSFFLTCPHCEQTCGVNWGSTLMSVLPASSALREHICTKVPQPASKIDLFKPAFAAAPLGRYAPFSSCLGFGFLVRLLV